LDVDSENDSAFDSTGWTDAEDEEEDDETQPGKYVGVNDGDINSNGIPNYAEGYDRWFPGANAGGVFTPMALELKDPIELDTAKIKFTYSCSDPKDVLRTGAGSDRDPYRFTAPDGHLRIWKKDGSADRRMAEVDDNGDFVNAGVEYDAHDLGFGPDRTILLYLEGINSSDQMGDQRIVVEVIPDPDRPLVCTDAVRCTLLKASIVPDWNHDRKIDVMDRDQATAINPFRFWINDDKDDGDVADGDSDVPGKSNGNAVADKKVNGRCDLLDFFPVWLDIGNILKLLPNDYDCVFVLRQDSGAVNFFHSKLSCTNAGDYLINDSPSYGWTLSGDAYGMHVVHVPGSGVDMDVHGTTLSMEIESDPEKGVLILEGKVPTASPLVLEIRKGCLTGAVLYETRLPLSLSSVEAMFRHKNLINMAGGGGTAITVADRNIATNYPDFLSSDKWLVFLHGVNVTENDAKGWHCEMFKRLYWSGSRARFVGITYRAADGAPWNYHPNANNAFQTAEALANYVNGLGQSGGGRVVAAHSMGNIVASSAITDHFMQVSNYFLLNAAVPTEAYDSTTWNILTNGNRMLSPAWRNYNSKTWASTWHQLFTNDANDARANLTWINRFAKSIPIAYNFYSSGDEVFEIYDGLLGVITGVQWVWGWPVLQGEKRYSWHKQELFKGMSTFGGMPLGSSLWAGWGFRGVEISDPYGGGTYIQPTFTAEQANFAMDDQLRATSVFRGAPDFMFSSNVSREQQNSLLAAAIPAMSYATGRNVVGAFSTPRGSMNYDMTDFRSGWPRNHPIYGESWLHSDVRDVAYIYTSILFDGIVAMGDLR
jgi:hypothetical protein